MGNLALAAAYLRAARETLIAVERAITRMSPTDRCYERHVPDYIEWFKTDWGYAALSAAEQASARACEAVLRAEPDITAEWLAQQIAAATSMLPGRRIRVQAADGGGELALVANDGRIGNDPEPVELTDDADITTLLTADDYRAAGVTRIWTMLVWTQPLLEAVIAKASELDTSVSWVVQSAWQRASNRLDKANLAPYEGDRRKQSVFLLVDQWAELEMLKKRDDRAASWFVQRAVAVALPELTAR